MKVFLSTLGCRLNEAERAAWGRDFAARGHAVIGDVARADVVVLNTCVVTEEAARKTRKLARRLRRQAGAEAKVVLAGCYVDIEAAEAAELADVDLVVPNRDKDDLVATVIARFGDPVAAEPPPSLFEAGRTRSFVKVQDGCRNRCAYCVVTIARGEERSRPLDDVVAEVEGLVAAGRQEVVLTGAHLGGYGSDLPGVDLQRLVAAVLERTAIARLRLSSLEPWDLPEGFFALWRDRRLCPHLHLPLQSGSDAVLRRMARRCDVAGFMEVVERAREAIEGLEVTTDLIVGFPGETAEDFEASARLVGSAGFAHVHVFAYSPRPGTKATAMAGQVAEAVKHARSQRLHEVAAASRRARLATAVGTRRPVLWETRREHEGGQTWYSGLTDSYLRVEVPASAATPELENRITTTELVEAREDHLLGRLDPPTSAPGTTGGDG